MKICCCILVFVLFACYAMGLLTEKVKEKVKVESLGSKGSNTKGTRSGGGSQGSKAESAVHSEAADSLQ